MSFYLWKLHSTHLLSVAMAPKPNGYKKYSIRVHIKGCWFGLLDVGLYEVLIFVLYTVDHGRLAHSLGTRTGESMLCRNMRTCVHYVYKTFTTFFNGEQN